MRLVTSLLVVVGLSTIAPACAAGLQWVTTPGAPAIRAAVWSPCAEPAGEVKVRSLTLAATENCPIEGENLPLVVISHGYGGGATSHHDLAEALAKSGFVVVALSHPADSGADASEADTLAALTERPADVTRLIDFMLNGWPGREKLDPQRIGLFGFSRGGFTGLVVAGGDPDFNQAEAMCPQGARWPICAALRAGATTAFAHDPRVKALVVADPAFGPLFPPDRLKTVTVPIQLWQSQTSGEDMTGGEVAPEFVSAIRRALPTAPEFHLVAGAGHFAFLPPCTPELAKRIARICVDRAGFDRAAFHAQFNAQVSAFFLKSLASGRQP